ncbi:MAG: hypothetical protein JNM98_03950 [Rhodocyclaceae bacterium]|nr:hypothetical protein [Rhodocyclaceae bacterium]
MQVYRAERHYSPELRRKKMPRRPVARLAPDTPTKLRARNMPGTASAMGFYSAEIAARGLSGTRNFRQPAGACIRMGQDARIFSSAGSEQFAQRRCRAGQFRLGIQQIRAQAQVLPARVRGNAARAQGGGKLRGTGVRYGHKGAMGCACAPMPCPDSSAASCAFCARLGKSVGKSENRRKIGENRGPGKIGAENRGPENRGQTTFFEGKIGDRPRFLKWKIGDRPRFLKGENR